jgi:hypothetical protein
MSRWPTPRSASRASVSAISASAATTVCSGASARTLAIGVATGIASHAGSALLGRWGRCAASSGETPGKSPSPRRNSISWTKRRYGSRCALFVWITLRAMSSPSTRDARQTVAFPPEPSFSPSIQGPIESPMAAIKAGYRNPGHASEPGTGLLCW